MPIGGPLRESPTTLEGDGLLVLTDLTEWKSGESGYSLILQSKSSRSSRVGLQQVPGVPLRLIRPSSQSAV